MLNIKYISILKKKKKKEKRQKAKRSWLAGHNHLEQNWGPAQRRPKGGPLPISLAWPCKSRKINKSDPHPERQEANRPFSEGRRMELCNSSLATYISTISSQRAAIARTSWIEKGPKAGLWLQSGPLTVTQPQHYSSLLKHFLWHWEVLNVFPKDSLYLWGKIHLLYFLQTTASRDGAATPSSGPYLSKVTMGAESKDWGSPPPPGHHSAICSAPSG